MKFNKSLELSFGKVKQYDQKIKSIKPLEDPQALKFAEMK